MTEHNTPITDFRRVCGWCLRPVDGLGPVLPEEPQTTTICQACRERVEADLDEEERGSDAE